MPFFKSLPDDAGPANVFTKYPEIYRLWSTLEPSADERAITTEPG